MRSIWWYFVGLTCRIRPFNWTWGVFSCERNERFSLFAGPFYFRLDLPKDPQKQMPPERKAKDDV